jgi:hypothetical protein
MVADCGRRTARLGGNGDLATLSTADLPAQWTGRVPYQPQGRESARAHNAEIIPGSRRRCDRMIGFLLHCMSQQVTHNVISLP